ncbi:MAG: hypothetical protein IPN32_34540 [Deltaproteobacteria bacterium]|nr:hypothetical protein [Deltaproteobacteria bacterium]
MVVQGRRVALRSGCVVAWLSACAGTGLDGGTDGSSSETGGTADSSGGAGTVATTRGGETTVGSVDGSGDSSGAGASSESSSGAAASSEGTTGEPFPEPVPDDCITDVTAGHHAFVCDGLTYDVEVPAACLLAPCGMIVDVHGLAMSAQMQDSNTNMRALGQRYGYIVVQPNADPAPPLSNWIPGIDDPKVFDFMQRTAAAWHVDADRWHFTGFSQGGFMTWRFACAHADVLASVAPGAACGNDFPIEDCQFTDDESPSEPLDIPLPARHAGLRGELRLRTAAGRGRARTLRPRRRARGRARRSRRSLAALRRRHDDLRVPRARLHRRQPHRRRSLHARRRRSRRRAR